LRKKFIFLNQSCPLPVECRKIAYFTISTMIDEFFCVPVEEYIWLVWQRHVQNRTEQSSEVVSFEISKK